MREIHQIFGEKLRAIIPLFETDIKGTEKLLRTVDYVFKPNGGA
jgi:hypothetical protein